MDSRRLATSLAIGCLLASLVLLNLPNHAVARAPAWGTSSPWYVVSAITDNSTIEAVKFVDAQHGWAVGTNGGLFVTTDGGQTWNIRSSGTSADLYAISFADAQNGYILGVSGSGGFLLRTQDGGVTWAPTASPSSSSYLCSRIGLSVAAASATTVYVTLPSECGGGGLFGSADGGKTWTNFSIYAQLVTFTSANEGWLAVGATLEHTTDGANTWSVALNANGTIDSISTPAPGTIVVGTSSDIYASANGGVSWSDLSGNYNLTSAGSSTQWLDASGSQAWLTSDGGQTGQLSSLPNDPWSSNSQQTLTAEVVGFRDATDPYIIAQGQNSGLSYFLAYGSPPATASPSSTPASPPGWGASSAWYVQSHISNNSTIEAVKFVDAQHGWAVGTNGGLFVTTDGGQTWNIRSSGTSADLYAISFADAQNGYILGVSGSGGFLLRTQDGGVTWAPTASPSSSSYLCSRIGLSVAAASATTVYVTLPSECGGGGLFGSADGGKTWTNFSIYAQLVTFTSANEGWLAARSTLYHTTDGANTWKVALNANGTIDSISTPAPGTIVVATSIDAYASVDDGATWTDDMDNFSLFSAGSSNQWLDASGSKAWLTGDAGHNWISAALPTDPSSSYTNNLLTAQSVGFRDANDPYIIGQSQNSGVSYFLVYGNPPPPTPTNTPVPTNTAIPSSTPTATSTNVPSRTPTTAPPTRTPTSAPTRLPGATDTPSDTPIALPSVPSDTDTPQPPAATPTRRPRPRPRPAATPTGVPTVLGTTSQRQALRCNASTLQQVVNCVQPSVLRIDVQFSDGEAEGTGFVVQSDGSGTYILTNRHVVDGATAGSIRVIAPNGHTSYKVQAVAINNAKVGTAGDLAVLKVPATSLRPLAFGTSDALQTGQTVASIGYGLAFQLAGPPSVTEGIISALHRDLGDGFGPVWIQHQSTINHGNSGGPLLDLKGNVVGVNTLSIDQLPGANGNEPVQGIFFAIPSSIARDVARTLVRQLHGGSFSELKATAAHNVQVKTVLFRAVAPRGWISGKIGADRPLLLSRDGLVQVQFQTVTVGHSPSAARLREMIAHLVHAVGKTRSLSYSVVRAGTLHGVIGNARYSNRTYRLTVAALPDKKGRHVFIVAVIQRPGASSADGSQAMAIITSLRATGR